MSKAIAIKQLSYAYPPLVRGQAPVWVLQDIDLEIEQGEFVSIMGPTGIGKSTLCLALVGIVPQSTGGTIKGDVFVHGMNTKQHPVPELAQQVGLVFQDPETQLFNPTAEAEVAFGLESLGIPPDEIGRRIDWALEVVGIRSLRERHPAQMSGGEKQRLAVASILAMKPSIIVLDEPTSNLDPAGKQEVFAAVAALREAHGATIVIVEHESEYIAEHSDRVVVMSEGTVTLAAPPAEVFGDLPRMRSAGLAVPQVSEVAACLNEQHGMRIACTRLDEASRLLRSQFDAR